MSHSPPDYLIGCYRRYKSDTQYIATWLASTAKKCGFVADTKAPAAPAPKSNAKPAPKYAKTRKQRKRAEAAQSQASPQQTGQIHNIKLKDFISLAKLIAGFEKPPVDIPKSLLAVFTRAIAARKRCAAWFQKEAQGDKAVIESNRMHSHFIGVLEETLVALKPRCAPETIEDPLMQAAENHDLSSGAALSSELNNIFNALELEEPSQEMQEMPAVSKEAAAHQPPFAGAPEQAEVEFESDEVEQEMFFAAYCLFADLNRIRTFIRELWKQYHQDKVDLITASVTTNTAIELGRRIQADFDNSFEINDALSSSMLVQQLAGIITGQMPGQRVRSGDEANFSRPEANDFFFLVPLLTLEAYTRVLEDGSLPVFKPETFGKYNPNLEWSRLEPREQFQQDKVLLLEYLPEPTLLQILKLKLPAEDAITVILRQFAGDRKMPIHTLFAAQVLLDMHHTLGPKVSKCLIELQVKASQIKSTVGENQKFHAELRVPNWSRQNDRMVQEFMTEIDESVLKDFIGDLGNRARSDIRGARNPEAFHWYKANPLLCGMRLFSLRLMIQEIGVTFIGAWGTWWLAHLYNAARQMHSTRLGGQILDAQWPDMDILIDMQGETRVFVGSAPTTVDESLKRITLIMGYSAGNLTRRGNRQQGLQESTRGPRGLASTAPVSRIFRDQLNDSDKATAALHQVEELFKLAAARDRLAPEKHSTAKILRRMVEKTTLTPIQLLTYLRDSIASEVPDLYFDYLSFHRRCWQLHRAIDTAIQADLIEKVGPGYMEHEYHLPWLTPWIFSIVSGVQMQDRIPMGGRNDRMRQIGLRDRGILLKANEVLKEFISREGSVEKERLKSICGDFEYTPLVPASVTNGESEEYARNMDRINRGYEAMVLEALTANSSASRP
ncbi:MAG: hypothetical protein Q9227_005770 [Pyrenula ochraceoflavens]